MTGALCERDGLDLECFEKAQAKIEEAVKIAGAYFGSQKRVAAYRVFRSSQTKERLSLYTPQMVQMKFDLDKAG